MYQDPRRDVRNISDHKYRVNVLRSGVFPPFESAIVLFYHAKSLHHCRTVHVALWRLHSADQENLTELPSDHETSADCHNCLSLSSGLGILKRT